MLIRLFLITAELTFNLSAQQGDAKDSAGEKQISRVPEEKIPPSPVLTAEQALKSFKVAPGFRVEIVADDKLLHDPVAMTFDPDGRIWVAEMRGYMRDFEGTGEDQPHGTIAVLEDTDGDGRMDKRTVFLDGLVMPRAVSLVRGGVLVATPPQLWFCRDTNGDLKCDEKVLVAGDYGDTKNPEHTANGLIWALDNWIYSADFTVRFKSLPGSEWKRENTAFRGQWGISQDDFGRLVYNSNSDQFRMDLVPSHYLQRNPSYRGAAGLNFDPIRDQTTWPIRVTPGVNRGYRDGVLREDGTLTKFTAACGPLIYRGDNFPSEFYGNAFVCEPAAHLIKRNLLWEKDGEMQGRHAYEKSEFLASTDERFRPVNLYNGPDGAMYIVDLYRGVIQHKIFLTTYLRKQSEARGLDKPIGLGRIYRVVHEGKPLKKAPQLAKASSAKLVEELSNPNAWHRETAQRLLVERNDVLVAPSLKQLAKEGVNHLGRLHAFWTLEGMNQVDAPTVLKGFQDKHPKVRAIAVRLAEPLLIGPDKNILMPGLIRLVNDRAPEIQLQLAFTFGEIKDPRAEAGMSVIARNSSGSVYVRDALLTGLHQREVEFLEKLLKDKAWADLKTGNDAFFSNLAKCIFTEAKPDRVERLFGLIATANDWQRAALLRGIASTAPPASKDKVPPNIKPLRLAGEPPSWKDIQSRGNGDTVEVVKKVSELITWPGRANYEMAKAARPLTAEEMNRFNAGKELYTAVCAPCHQPTGLGLDGLAPPLADSEWVLGSDQRLARILLHGVRGPITVKGKLWEMEMPGLNVLDDEQLASIITYIRREWDHGGEPVGPELVKKVREGSGNRQEAWSEAELLKVQ